MSSFEFSRDWFSHNIPLWRSILNQIKPTRILEIGSYEGRSACFLIEEIAAERPLELVCIDLWRWSDESAEDSAVVESRFDRNIEQAINSVRNSCGFLKVKSRSSLAMANLLIDGKEGYFDLVYVDGSHRAPDVLSDLVMAYQLCRVGGCIICDDYLWADARWGGEDVLNRPKIAIDAFTTIYTHSISFLPENLYQVYLLKSA